jgi:hypothetical protein
MATKLVRDQLVQAVQLLRHCEAQNIFCLPSPFLQSFRYRYASVKKPDLE